MSDYYGNDSFNHDPTPPPPPEGSKTKAIISMILGILSLLLCCCWYISVPLAIASLVLGILAIKNNEPGRGMAIAGIVTSSVGIVLLILLFGLGMAIGDFDPDYLEQYLLDLFGV
jgi:hypothetical protein